MKTKRVIDKKYLLWLRDKPCLVCGFTPSDPHHVFTGGMGTKCDDNLAIPLCHKHHTELHDNGKKTFTAKYNLDYNLAIETLNSQYKEFLCTKK